MKSVASGNENIKCTNQVLLTVAPVADTPEEQKQKRLFPFENSPTDILM